MPKTEKKDLRLLQIMQFLSRESSDDHPLSMADILHYLQNKGICCARKAVGRDIASLRAFGYPILFTRTPTAGYYLASRDLKTPEVRILIDAVNAAPFLTEEMTCNLTEKLQNMVDRRDCAALQKQIYYDPVYKQSNAEIGSTINTLYQAIALGKKVNFRYYHCAIRDSRIQPDEGRLFSISPYALFWHGDYYYLAGNYQKYSNVANYRLDRMYGVQKLPEDARPFSEVTRYTKRFDTADYLRHQFFLFGGREEELLIRCENNLLDVVNDRFGAAIEILEYSETQFTAHVSVCVSEGLYAWILQCGSRLAVLAPTYVRDEVRSRIDALCRVYHMTEKEEPPETGG